jgi:hypothetical protein
MSLSCRSDALAPRRSYPIDVARARMAVAPKGVAQNLVSVFLEMVRHCFAPAALYRSVSSRLPLALRALAPAAARVYDFAPPGSCGMRGVAAAAGRRVWRQKPLLVGCVRGAVLTPPRSRNAVGGPAQVRRILRGADTDARRHHPLLGASFANSRWLSLKRTLRLTRAPQGTTWATYETLKERMLRARHVAARLQGC